MNNFKLAVLILLMSMALWNIALSQSDTAFWFVAPEVTNGHSDRPVFLRLSSYSEPATITISQPSNPGFVPIEQNLGANQTASIDLTSRLNQIENRPAASVLNKGIYIHSTATIGVYYEVQSGNYSGSQNNTDIFSLKGRNALGEYFLIPAQDFWENADDYTPQAYSGFEIVATEDNTTVNINPTDEVVKSGGAINDNPYSITLNKGNTYSVRAAYPDANRHLSGTEVSSNKPIAITITDDSGENSSYGTCQDLMGDQLVPVRVTGREYIVVRGALYEPPNTADMLGDKIVIMATEDNTEVIINDGEMEQDYIFGIPIGIDPVITEVELNRGEYIVYDLSYDEDDLWIIPLIWEEHFEWGNATYIQSDKDIYVMHITGFGCEVGGAILPPLYCTGSNQVSFTRSSSDDFYMISLIPAGGQGQFSNFFGADDFNNVPGTEGQWKWSRKSFTTGQIAPGSNHILSNGNRKFHLGIVNGGELTGCKYGYFSDFNQVFTNPIYHY